jgi:hypothetical protein
MTLPSPDALEREKDKLYLTEAEMFRRLGVPYQKAKTAVRFLQDKQGFPHKSKLFDRYYWPAVKAWLDKNNGLNPQPARSDYTPRGTLARPGRTT